MECLVTKLKGVVDDDNLNILGAYYLTKIEAGKNVAAYISNLTATEANKCVLMVRNGTLNVAGVDYTQNGYPIGINQWSSPLLITVNANAKDAYLYVTNRSYLKEVNMNFSPCKKTNDVGDAINLVSINAASKDGEVSPFNFSKLQSFILYSDVNETVTGGTLSGSKAPELRVFSVTTQTNYNVSELEIDVDTLDFPKLESFAVNRMNLKGSIASLSSINLTSITIAGKGNFNSSNIEAFAQRQVALGRKSGTCTVKIETETKTITFNEEGYDIQ